MKANGSFITLLVTMAVWGSTFAVTKDLIGHLPPLAVAFVRVTFGSLALFAAVGLRRRRPQRAPLPWWAILQMAFVGVAAYYMAFNLSLSHIPASQGALVQSSIPAVTALVAILWLRERPSVGRLAGIALSVVGVLIVFSGGSQDEGPSAALLGNALMFASVVCWGIYTSLAKRVADHDQLLVTACVTGLGALMLLPLALLELTQRELVLPGAAAWLGLLYLGVVASGIAYLLYNRALQHMDASQVGVFTNLIPIVGVICGIVFLHEPLSLRAIIGGLVVFAGVWVTARQR